MSIGDIRGFVSHGRARPRPVQPWHRKGAVGLEFSEANGLLAVTTSSRFGVEADRRAMDPAFALQPVGAGSGLEVDGRKVTFVDAKGGKFDLGLKPDGTFKGTIDPRGTPGRERWSVANIEGKCTNK
jgi:hypothetical protein